MNDPSTKYVQPEPLAFFNYHEFLVSDYAHCESSLISSDFHDTSIVVNHFPNPYALRGSEHYENTRIIRIPRAFDLSENLYMVPQFSVITPGQELAAISSNGPGADFCGEFDGCVFGTTSSTVLVPGLLGSDELRQIVEKINSILKRATTLKVTWMDNVLDFFSATLYSRVYCSLIRETHYKRTMAELEEYVEEVNVGLGKRCAELKLISPVESAFLSLDFQIPKPAGRSMVPGWTPVTGG